MGLEYDLTHDDIVIPDTCPIFDIPLIFDGRKRTDNSASIDRIDNSKGYVKGNVVVVSYKANRLKSDATLDELQTLIDRYRTLMK